MSLELLDPRYVMQHRGSHSEFLKRYEIAASVAGEAGQAAYEDFCRDLIHFVSDERNLMTAADHLRRYGGSAPGPNGIRLDDYSQIDLWAAVRELRDRLRTGTYERGPLKKCRVPKQWGTSEKRTIFLTNVLDRVVSVGTGQILMPLLERIVDPLSFCWRRKGVQLALAFARKRLAEEGRTTWIVEDIRHAFDVIPRSRLLQILKHYVPNDQFCDLVLRLAAAPTRRGVLQGSPVSMLLLDVYLGHLLHRPWCGDHDLPRLVRYVDDILITIRPEDDAKPVYERLTSYITAAGMQAKHGLERARVDLRYETAEWLGYRLRWRRDELEIRSKLFDTRNDEQCTLAEELIFTKFAQLHDKCLEPWRYANAVVRGMIAHLAPTLPFVEASEIYGRIASAARHAGFDEIMAFPEALWCWESDYERWQWVCDHLDRLCVTPILKPSGETVFEEDVFTEMDSSIAPWE